MGISRIFLLHHLWNKDARDGAHRLDVSQQPCSIQQMVDERQHSNPPPSSLYFLSTQIQSRHEEQERRDDTFSKLQRFKNEPDIIERPKHSLDRRKTPTARKKSARGGQKKINSISAFVRETLGLKKPSESYSILDFFDGDNKKVDDLITRMEAATATPHLLSSNSRGPHSPLMSGTEWRLFMESLRLRFPSLSRKSIKSLRIITKRLEQIHKKGDMDESLQSLWSQASRQPSDELSADDIKWLYDLDDEQVENADSCLDLLISEDHTSLPFILTLSQVLDEQPKNDDDNHTIENSQSEVEALSECELAESLVESLVDSHEHPTSRLKLPETVAQASQIPGEGSLDLLVTSIPFQQSVSTYKATPASPAVHSDVEYVTPTKKNLDVQIDSSPVSAKSVSQHEAFFTPVQKVRKRSLSLESDDDCLELSPLRKKALLVEELRCSGQIALRNAVASGIHFRLRSEDSGPNNEIPDSEDEHQQHSIVEIIRSPMKSSATPVKIQVPSSPDILPFNGGSFDAVSFH